jgi:predicted ATPase
MAAFVERLVTVARSSRILITSQVPLNIKAEYAVNIGGMDVPAPGDADAASYPSVALFAQHAERIAGDFDLAKYLPDVAALCADVGGNPLAIELSAAWSRLMAPAQIRSEIQRSSDFLTSNASDIPERHRSMRAVFDWMWARFSPDDRDLAIKFAVFSGDFSPETASAVTGASPAMLHALADRSLVMLNGGRCRIHGLLRSFLIEKLHDLPELRDAIQYRHAEHMAAWARDQIAGLMDHTVNDSVAQMIREADNLSSAWDYAIAAYDFAILEPLAEANFYFHRAMNRYAEGAALMDEAVTASAGRDPQVHARFCAFAGVLHMSRSRYEEARALLTAGISQLAGHDLQLLRIAHDALGGTAYAQGDYETSRASFETALDIAYHINDQRGAAYALFRLGDIQAVLGDYEGASALLSEGLALGDDAASPHDRVRYLNLLADLSCKSGDYVAARGYADEALSAATVMGSRVQRGVALATLGRAAYGRKAYKESRDFLRRSIAQAEEIGNRWGKAFAQAYLARTCWQLNELAAARFHLEQAQTVANDIQSAWLMAFIQRLRALPNIDRSSNPLPALGIALHLARSIRAIPLALDALAAIATGLSEAGEHEAAAQFAQATAADPTAEADAREIALHVLAGLPEMEISALTRDQAFDLAVTMSGRFHPHIA